MYGNPDFGAWLKQRRVVLGLTHQQLALRLACSLSLVRKYERGERRPPRDVAERLAQVLEIAPEQRAAFVAAALNLGGADTPAIPPDLPLPPTQLLGRDANVTEAVQRLSALGTRMLTLTGPPGVGKTRLAQAITLRIYPQFAEHFCYRELATAPSAIQALQGLLSAFNLRETAHTPALNTLIEFLRNRRALLVLDNLEHLTDLGALLAEILARCPQVKLLATSREPLRIRAERVFPVEPLDLPISTEFAQIAGSPAVALYCERAEALRPQFRLTEANASAVAAICTRLDGLPLAIELAAARSDQLAPGEIAAHLDQCFATLTGGLSDLPPRQQTLRDAIAWSFALLDPPTQRLFARLGVFVGGWDWDAAAAICMLDSAALRTSLERLVLHHLVRRQRDANGSERFSMLETLREFAREQLAERGEAALMAQRHAVAFAEYAERLEPDLRGSAMQQRFRQIDTDLDNFRTAVQWSHRNDDSLIAARISAALFAYLHYRGMFSEGRRWCEAQLSLPDIPWSIQLQARVHYAIGFLSSQQSDLASVPIIERSVSLFRQTDDWRGLARALNLMGMINRWPSGFARAEAFFKESLALQRAHGDESAIGGALYQLAAMAVEQARYAEAIKLIEETIAAEAHSGRAQSAARCLPVLAEAQLHSGDLVAAHVTYTEALHQARHYRDRETEAESLRGLSMILAEQGDLAQAETYLQQSATLLREIGVLFALVRVLRDQGYLALRQGQVAAALAPLREGLGIVSLPGFAENASQLLRGAATAAAASEQHHAAARLFGAAARLVQDYDLPDLAILQRICAPAEHATRVALNRDLWQAAWAEGNGWDFAQAVNLALSF